jgi:hypothetical protein
MCQIRQRRLQAVDSGISLAGWVSAVAVQKGNRSIGMSGSL